MCVVSMIYEHYWDKWNHPPYHPWVIPTIPAQNPPITIPIAPTDQEIEEFKKLVERARRYDQENNQPDCELEEKREKILDLANKFGIKIDFI